jgi:hypothetical protein
MGILHLLQAALALAAAQPAAPARDAAALPTATQIAAAMQRDLPRQLSGGFVLTAARADGALLILNMAVPAEAGTMESGQFALNIARGFCRGPRAQAMFDSGLRMRIDVAVGGAPIVPGTVIERCPEPPAVEPGP